MSRHLTVSRGRLLVLTIVLVVIVAVIYLAGGIDVFTGPVASLPKAYITSPSPGSTPTEALITVEGAAFALQNGASSYPPTTVTLKVNGDAVGIADTNHGSFQFANVSLRRGGNTIHIDAREQVGWRRFDVSDEISVTFIPAVPTIPKIDPIPTSISSNSLAIEGAADPAVTVHVLRTARSVDGTASEPQEVAQKKTDATTGRFSADVNLYPPGSYELTVYAVNDKETKSKVSTALRVIYDPLSQSMAKLRALTLTITTTSLHAEFEIGLTADDQRGARWLNGDLTLSELVDQVFGPVYLNSLPLSSMFDGVEGRKSLSGDGLDVKGQSNPELESTRLSKRFTVDVKEGTFLSAPNDSLTLVVKDYGITSVHPLPSALGDAGPTWRGPIGLIDPSLSVDLNIWHASPLVLLRLRPYDLLNWPWSVFVDFLYVLMNSLALFWYLWLVRRHPEAPWPAGKAGSRLNLLMQWVIGVCFVPLVLDLAQALTPGLDSEAVLSAIGLVLAIALWAVFRKRDQNTVGYLALVLLRAAMIALAAAAIIFGVVYAWWQLPFFIDYRVVAWVLDGAILTVVLYASVEVVLEVFAAESRITQNALWRFLLRATLILAVLAVSIPVATSDYRATGIGNTDSLLQTISASFQLLQYYAAYVVLIGLAAVLRRTVGSTDPRIRRLVVGVAFLLFVNFVVSIDPYFFLPLSFVLGLITFWLLLVVRTDERNGLLDDAQEIRDKRADLLDQLEKTSVARQLRSAVEALTKKVADGTMTMETFESRSAKVDAYLKAHEEGTSVQTASGKGRLGRRVVLAYGPGNDEWSNGLHGALIGLIIAVPWLIFYIGFFLFRAGQISSPVKPLVITDVVIFEPFSWALLGFFFGYFFTYFRGNTGLQKGLWVALVFSICMAPYWLTSPRSVPDALATALVVCTYILVFTGTGLWFDVESLRAGLGARFDWNSFGRLTGLGSITAFGSVVLATVGLALTSVLTGAVVSIAGLLLHAVGAPVPATPTH